MFKYLIIYYLRDNPSMREFTRLRPPFIIRLSLVSHAGRWHGRSGVCRTVSALIPRVVEGERSGTRKRFTIGMISPVRQPTRRGGGERQTAALSTCVINPHFSGPRRMAARQRPKIYRNPILHLSVNPRRATAHLSRRETDATQFDNYRR